MAGHFSGNPNDFSGGANAPHISRYYLARGWVKPSETVLDAGCGAGYGSVMIAEFAKRVIGVDADAPLIESAQKDYQQDNLEFRHIDLGKDEIPEVDVAICIECAEHINGLDNFVKELHKKVKRMFIICVPLGGTSYAYTEEQKATPAGENNDFNNMAHVEEVFTNDEWKVFTSFQYGYSGILVFSRVD